MKRTRKILLAATLSAIAFCVGAAVFSACKHDEYGDWETRVEPACTQAGEMIRYDLNDKEKYETKEIPALGHLYEEDGGWEIIDPPTFASEGVKKRICERCGVPEYRSIDMLQSSYVITVMDGSVLLESVYITEDGKYEVGTPSKLGYAFDGFFDEEGNPFATTGTVDKNMTVHTSWTILPTLTFAELKERAAAGVDKILLGADIVVSEAVHVTGKTQIYATQNHTLTRGAEFGGDMFIVGENTVVGGKTAELTLKTENGACLTIDGNKDNCAVEVSGTAFLLLESCVVNMYDGVTIANCKKTGNTKLTEGNFLISYPNKIGGAAMIVVNGTFNMYGGCFENNEVNQDETSFVEDESDDLRASSCGGAIYNYAAVNIYGGTFADNRAARGGAIYNYRTLRVYAAAFENNYASVYAGAVYLPASQYSAAYFGDPAGNTAENAVLFSQNSSEKSGGAIFGQMKNSVVIYGGTTFAENTAKGNNGGAINTSGALIINNAVFTQNIAASKGGAIYAYYSDEELTTRQVDIKGGSFIGNMASKGGAVAFSASQTDFDHGSLGAISGTLFKDNEAYATSTADPELPDEGEGDEGASEKNFNGNGGAVYISRKSTVSISGNCTFTNNGAERKGGAVYVTDSELDIDTASFISNTSGGNGGAVYCYTDSSVEISGAAFTSNRSDSTAQGGGALYFTGTNGTLSGCAFTNNSSAQNGGAFCAYSESVVTVSGTTFSGNEAKSTTNGGGGAYISKSEATFEDCTFTGNRSAKNGGAVSAYSASEVTFLGETEFSDNFTAENGGALYVSSSGTKVTIDGTSTFEGNTADKYGGGIYATGPSAVTINNVNATGNAATSGGFLYFTTTGTVVTILEGEAVDNTASTSGATACGNATKAVLRVTDKFVYPDGSVEGKYTLETIES